MRIPVHYGIGLDSDVFPDALKNYATNDLHEGLVWVFKDTAALEEVGGRLVLPDSLSGLSTATFTIRWATTATTGNAVWQVRYVPIADGETLDPSAWTQTVGSGAVAAPGTALLMKETDLTLTFSNFAAGDEVILRIGRDGAGSDTIAASLLMQDAFLELT